MGYNDPIPAGPVRSRPKIEPDSEAQIEWADETDLAEPPEQGTQPQLIPYQADASIAEAAATSSPPPKPHAKSIPKPKPATKEPPARSIPAGMIEVQAQPSFAERIVRNKNVLIFTGVALLALATVGFRVRQSHLETLPAVVERGRTEGLGKLDLGDFQVAKQLLKEAAAAVEALGGRVAGAEDIRQGAREAALFADRVGERLENLLESASKADSESTWNSKFNTFYKSQSVIFEVTITATPDPNKPDSAYQIDYEVLYGGAIAPAGRGRIDLTGFLLFENEKPKVGEVKTFGARLAGMSFDKTTGVWLIRLLPDSGCFITHTKALQTLGWPSGEMEDSP